jgi:hypothetical protein
VLTLGGVYALTLLPGVGYSGDTAKFQFLGKVLGTPHATGYPTYLVLNHLFVTLFPLGSLAYKANLLSAVFTVAAAVVLLQTLRALGISRFIAVLTPVTFGLTATVWLHSLVAEVYSLHLLFVALVIHFFLRWTQTRADRYFLAAWACYGLSFGNHLTTVTLLPAILYVIWATDRTVFRDRRKLLAMVLFLALGALQYVYIFWRYQDPATPYAEMRPNNLQELLWYLTGAGFRDLMFAFSPMEVLTQRVPMFVELLWKQFFILLPVALYGLLRFDDKTFNRFLILAFLGNAFYAINYDILDIFVYFMPNYLITAIYLGQGLEAIRTRLPLRASRLADAVFLALPLLMLAVNYQAVSQRDNTADAQRIEEILQQVERDAVIFSSNYHDSEYLWYYLVGEGLGSRNIHVLHRYPSEAIQEYLEEGQAISLPGLRQTIPPGLDVYTIGAEQQLRDLGLPVEEVGNGLYAVAN